MAIKEGDFILLDYTGSTGGKVFDTSIEAVAKENKAYTPGRAYKPLVVVVGKGDVIPGLDKALVGMGKGEEKKVVIAPEDGYGKRDPSLIKIVPLKAFTSNKISPYPGMPVQLDNMLARVQSVSGGRVRVDFNHELAGKELTFDIKVVDVITKDEDKIRALAGQLFKEGDVAVGLKGGKAIITPKSSILAEKGYGKSKAYLLASIKRHFPDISVEFVEEYKKA